MSFAADQQQVSAPVSTPLGYYQHYKGQFYWLQAIATHSEEQQPYAVYQALYGEFGLWVRPLSMITEQVSIDGQLQPRFRFVGNELPDTVQPQINQLEQPGIAAS